MFLSYNEIQTYSNQKKAYAKVSARQRCAYEGP